MRQRNDPKHRVVVWSCALLALCVAAAPAAFAAKAKGKGKGKGAATADPATADPGAGGTAAPDATDAALTADADPAAAAPASAPTVVTEVRDFTASEVSVKMKDTGERVSELKEKVFRTKARLVLLQETILGTGLSAAKASVIHRNEMGAAFKMTKLTYAVDGGVVYSKSDAAELSDKDEIEVWSGNLTPGNHQVSVEMVYRGHGFGVFSYLNKYTFKVKSSYTFHAEEGKFTRVKVVGYEKEGWTLPIEEKPTVRYDVEVLADEGAELVDKK